MFGTEHPRGLLLGLLVIKFGNALGFARGSSHCPTAFIVVATDDLLFASMGGAQGIWDPLHPSIVANPGVPDGWPGLCLTFDLTVGAGVLCTSHERSKSAQRSAP